MAERRIARLRDEYLRIAIPEELDIVVRNSLTRTKRHRSRLRNVAVAAAGVFCLVTVLLNAVPALAATLAEVPVLGKIVDVLTFTSFRESSEQQGYDLNIDVPRISGLDTALQDSLNQRYLAQARNLYASFMERIGNLEEGQLAHQALDAGYKVKVSTTELLVIEHWKVQIAASGTESVTYDTIDLHNEVVLTLPGLFADESYIETISANIKEQMAAQMAESNEVMYFTDPGNPSTFRQIASDQTFYINEDHKLVIVFDEYAVAPGFMGVVEFVIPTDVIADQLVGSAYIR